MLTDNSCCRDRWPPSGCSKLYAGERILLGNVFDLTKTPFFPAARPINAAKRGYSTDSTIMGFNGVLTDGAGGSAQTDLSNLVGLRDTNLIQISGSISGKGAMSGEGRFLRKKR